MKGPKMFKRLFSSTIYFVILTALVFYNNPIKQLAPSGPDMVYNPSDSSKPVLIETSLAASDVITHTVYLPIVLNNYNPNLLPVRGLYVSFERRGYGSGYYSGEAISNFTNFDDVVGHTVAEEISLQLDKMKQMGVNTITYELRSADPNNTGSFVFPSCNINAVLGLQYPQPTATEINNLKAFLDLLQSKGIKLFLRLVNTHMEEQPPTNNELWLGTILNAIKDHPALDLVLFEGSTHWIDSNGDNLDDACGIPAEPPLYMGPTTNFAGYVKWAVNYAHSLGMPYRELSAEAVVGDYFSINQGPSGPRATDWHLWDPIYVLKNIFDDLAIPTDQRTYAISFGEHRKCTTARQLPCMDTNPHEWAIETITDVFNVIGKNNGARVLATEMSLLDTEDANWNTELALESLVWVMKSYGVDGGCFYHWTNYNYWEEFDPSIQIPVKKRGTEFIYNPVKDILEELYTKGQTNSLNLTPETIPPVFSSVSTTPASVKNGDAFRISATLHETHLFVTANLVELDTTKTIPIVLIDQGDGTYARDVKVGLWNEARNGIKNLQIKAMDFWSNAVSTPIGIELNNPPPILDSVPPNDNFDGLVIDGSKWETESIGDGTITQNDRLIVTTSNAYAFSSAKVKSYWNFTSDFDAQVDFQIGAGWSRPLTDHLDGANFGVIIGGDTYLITRAFRDNGDNVLFAWSSTGTLLGEAVTTSLTGKLRTSRTGNTLILLFDFGTGWRELARATVASSPAKIYMGNGSINASQVITSYLDNFHINSGITTYEP
jgi:hypothetical protein